MSSPERRRFLVIVVVMLAALGVRGIYLEQLSTTPWWRALVVDEEAYHRRGVVIAAGDLRLGDRPYYQDPLYSYLLGGIYSLVGPRWEVVRLLQALGGTVGAGLVAWTTAVLAGNLAGLVAGLCLALAPSLLFYEGQIEKTGPTVAMTAVALVLGVRAARGGQSLGAWLWAGLPWGMLALLRGNYLLLLAPVALWAWLAGERRSGRALVFIVAMLLPIVPVTVRNLAVAGEFVLVTSQGGQNFYLGNWDGNPDGMYHPPPFLRPHPDFEEIDFAREAERRSGGVLTARETSRFWLREGLAHVAASPGRFLAFVGRRVQLALGPEDVPDNLDLDFVAERIAILRAPLPDFGLASLLGLPGLVLLARRRRSESVLVVGVAVGYLLTLLPFFVFGRYREPLLPLLSVGAGCFVADLVRWFRERCWWRLGCAAASVSLLFVLGRALPPVPHHEAQSWNTLGTVWEKLGDPGRARAAYENGSRLEPDHPLLSYNLGRLYAASGRVEEAATAYRRAILRLPGFAEAHANLGALLLDSDDRRAARFALEEALRLDAALAPAVFNLARLDELEGDFAQAARNYRAAAGLFPATSERRVEALRRALAAEGH